MKRIIAIIAIIATVFCYFALPASALKPIYNVSSSYKNSVFYTRLCSVNLTSNPRENIANIALSQEGYYESSNPDNLSGARTGSYNNYCEYNYWYGGRDYHVNWCGVFVSWCAAQAGISTSVIHKSCSGDVSAFCSKVYNFGSVTPEKGDIICTGYSNSHVAIITKVDSNYIYTMEGNIGSDGPINSVKVRNAIYSRSTGEVTWGGTKIARIGKPSYNSTTSENTSKTTSTTTTPVWNTNNLTVPGDVKRGSCFGLKGIVTCTVKMSNITAGIYTDSNGKNAKQKVSVNPGSTSYNLNGKVNNSLIFNNLPKGTYYYRITSTAAGKTNVLVNRQFRVVSSITISGVTKPTTLKKGNCFGLRGTISDVRAMNNVTAGIYTDANGKNAKQQVSVNPNASSYNLNGKVNNSLIFNNLPRGTYYYRVTARDSYGTEVLINQKFTVS